MHLAPTDTQTLDEARTALIDVHLESPGEKLTERAARLIQVARQMVDMGHDPDEVTSAAVPCPAVSLEEAIEFASDTVELFRLQPASVPNENSGAGYVQMVTSEVLDAAVSEVMREGRGYMPSENPWRPSVR